jgi:putative transposase
VPAEINQVWSMDFLSDSLKNGRSMRTFNVIDDFNRESLYIDVDVSLPSQQVVRSLQQIIAWRGKLLTLRCDNRPEFVSHELVDWVTKEQITLLYIQPEKPTQNAYIERFNRTARQDWLSLNLFEDIEHVQLLATQLQWTYNNICPHSAIRGVPPRQLLKLRKPLFSIDANIGGLQNRLTKIA